MPLERFFPKKQEDGFEEIRPGIRRYLHNDRWESQRKIGLYNYSVTLSKKEDYWELGFGTKEGDEGFTNQGLKVFNEVIALIKETIECAQAVDEVLEVRFGASKANYTAEQIKDMKEHILKIMKNNPEKMEGFSFKELNGWNLNIKDGNVTTDLVSESSPNKNPWTVTLPEYTEEFEKDGETANFIFKLYKYVASDENLKLKDYEIQQDKKKHQRILLYKRVLERSFPEKKVVFDTNKEEFIVTTPS